MFFGKVLLVVNMIIFLTLGMVGGTLASHAKKQISPELRSHMCEFFYSQRQHCVKNCYYGLNNCVRSKCDTLWATEDKYYGCHGDCNAIYLKDSLNCVHDECDCKYLSRKCPCPDFNKSKRYRPYGYTTDCPKGSVKIERIEHHWHKHSGHH